MERQDKIDKLVKKKEDYLYDASPRDLNNSLTEYKETLEELSDAELDNECTYFGIIEKEVKEENENSNDEDEYENESDASPSNTNPED